MTELESKIERNNLCFMGTLQYLVCLISDNPTVVKPKLKRR